jgi:hypothetical protein
MEQLVDNAKRNFSEHFFLEVIIISCWHIWEQRNLAIFEKILAIFRAWKGTFVHDTSLHMQDAACTIPFKMD